MIRAHLFTWAGSLFRVLAAIWIWLSKFCPSWLALMKSRSGRGNMDMMVGGLRQWEEGRLCCVVVGSSLCTDCKYRQYTRPSAGGHPTAASSPGSLPHWLAHVRSMYNCPGCPRLAVPYDSCITAYIAVPAADNYKLYAVADQDGQALDTQCGHSPLLSCLKHHLEIEMLTRRLYEGIKTVSTQDFIFDTERDRKRHNSYCPHQIFELN